jgi:hypothetical protein
MAIKIDMYDITGGEVFAAFYYEISPADYFEASEDPTRVPAGDQLTDAEKGALKDGVLFEVTKKYAFAGMNEAALQGFLSGKWNAEKPKATQLYVQLYGYTARRMDETGWS